MLCYCLLQTLVGRLVCRLGNIICTEIFSFALAPNVMVLVQSGTCYLFLWWSFHLPTDISPYIPTCLPIYLIRAVVIPFGGFTWETEIDRIARIERVSSYSVFKLVFIFIFIFSKGAFSFAIHIHTHSLFLLSLCAGCTTSSRWV